jgi:hypothetical protein
MSYEKIVSAAAKGSGTRLDKDEAVAVVAWVKQIVENKLRHVDMAADEKASAALAIARADRAAAAEKVLAATVANLLDVQADLTARTEKAEAELAAREKALDALEEDAGALEATKELMNARWLEMNTTEKAKARLQMAAIFGLAPEMADPNVDLVAAAASRRARPATATSATATAQKATTPQDRARSRLS